MVDEEAKSYRFFGCHFVVHSLKHINLKIVGVGWKSLDSALILACHFSFPYHSSKKVARRDPYRPYGYYSRKGNQVPIGMPIINFTYFEHFPGL